MSVLVDAVRGTDPRGRASAIDTLGEMGAPARAAAPELASALADRFHLTRKAAAAALGKIGPGARQRCRHFAALQDEDPEVSAEAKTAIERMRFINGQTSQFAKPAKELTYSRY